MIAKIAGIGNYSGGVTVTLLTHDGEKEKKRRYEVDSSDWESLGNLSVGDEIYDEEIAVIIRKTEQNEAFDRALRIVSMGDNSAKALCQKLVMRGFSRESAEYATAKVISLGYINEDEQLLRLVEYNVSKKLMGKNRLIPALVSKGYSTERIHAAIERALDEGTIDFDAAKKELLSQANTDDSMKIRKLLYTHGF